MKSKFVVGDRVGGIGFIDYDCDSCVVHFMDSPYNKDQRPYYGVISDVLPDGYIILKFDTDWLNYPSDRGVILNLAEQEFIFPEVEFKKTFSQLEKEFLTVSKEVAKKVKEAGKLLREAQKIAIKKTGNNLSDMKDVQSILFEIMDKCGWYSSSFNC